MKQSQEISVDHVLQKATQAFGSITFASTWLNSSNCLLGWMSPFDAIAEGNAEKVLNILSNRTANSGLA